ncbi:hypothetical protein YB2330_001785 [Saitoella coloradoensis]
MTRVPDKQVPERPKSRGMFYFHGEPDENDQSASSSMRRPLATVGVEPDNLSPGPEAVDPVNAQEYRELLDIHQQQRHSPRPHLPSATNSHSSTPGGGRVVNLPASNMYQFTAQSSAEAGSATPVEIEWEVDSCEDDDEVTDLVGSFGEDPSTFIVGSGPPPTFTPSRTRSGSLASLSLNTLSFPGVSEQSMAGLSLGLSHTESRAPVGIILLTPPSVAQTRILRSLSFPTTTHQLDIPPSELHTTPKEEILQALISACTTLLSRSACAIITSSAALAHLNDDLLVNLDGDDDVPCSLLGSLSQLTWLTTLLPPRRRIVGIITSTPTLTPSFLSTLGSLSMVTQNQIFIEHIQSSDNILHAREAARRMRALARNAGGEIGALILESLEMSAWTKELRHTLKLPVYDMEGLGGWMYEGCSHSPGIWGGDSANGTPALQSPVETGGFAGMGMVVEAPLSSSFTSRIDPAHNPLAQSPSSFTQHYGIGSLSASLSGPSGSRPIRAAAGRSQAAALHRQGSGYLPRNQSYTYGQGRMFPMAMGASGGVTPPPPRVEDASIIEWSGRDFDM